MTLAIEAPATSILFKSRVPMPTSSASFKVLSQSSKGGDPRSPMGSKFITAIETASVQTGFKPAAMNPYNNQRVPIWVANYILADYGTGAIMSVPAHDERDYGSPPSTSCPSLK